jgi:GrxC family glutaredoxin
MNIVEIYTKWTCGYCHMAKALLNKEGIEFEEIDVTMDQAKRTEMIERSGRQTVPQIFIKNESIGGYTELAQLSKTVNLNDLVTAENKATD